MTKPHVAMIGLGVMGSNLIQNIESRGIPCAVYNRTGSVTTEFMAQVSGRSFVAATTLEDLVQKMAAPRQIILMVKAGGAVDALIDALLPLLAKGDIIVDGGNTYFRDTEAREKKCQAAGINFLGVGISGGEEGALKGPSLMPGGPKEAYQIMSPMFEKIAAQADGACVTYIGPGGSGHFVKMVHNGIEYGDMQLIAEAYHLLKSFAGVEPPELSKIFTEWNRGPLSSFLIEITSKIFTKRDDKGDGFLVDKILDAAQQKGTGKWTAQLALDLGVAIPALAAAVDARILSSLKTERVSAAKTFAGPKGFQTGVSREATIQAIHDALYCSKIMSYAQGMAMLRAASQEYNWNLQLDKIAALWKGGCIIRARFLDQIRQAYAKNPALTNLVLDSAIKTDVERTLPGLRQVVSWAALAGVPVLAFGSSLSYFDSYRTGSLPQNLTQAQRDFFGAHTFERTDASGSFHADWNG